MEDVKNSSAGKFWIWLVLIAVPVGIIAYAVLNRQSDSSDMAMTNEQPITVDYDEMVTETATPTGTATPATPADTPAVVASAYKDGTYSATGDYMTPGGAEKVSVTLTVKDDVITDSVFEATSERPISVNMQKQFAGGYKEQVIGKKLDEINVGKVSGSSLTPKGFNDAVLKIKAQAKA